MQRSYHLEIYYSFCLPFWEIGKHISVARRLRRPGRHTNKEPDFNIYGCLFTLQPYEPYRLRCPLPKKKKTKFLLLNVKEESGTILIRNEELELVDVTVFLLITLKNKLQWGPHIGELAKRLSSADSSMSYGILLSSHAADVLRIFGLQKPAIRTIYRLGLFLLKVHLYHKKQKVLARFDPVASYPTMPPEVSSCLLLIPILILLAIAFPLLLLVGIAIFYLL
ncbi:hypothetical protein EVAR_6238_1 [Eumeta japonica]|uniref:Uncharacterized protein n=1 Tax=Eumeta variegata TaxID=151549 RepID=A0A4C1T831_EUMVA|nr:hypothetical protein EVAR_6238_1 [Eumeta japonica]